MTVALSTMSVSLTPAETLELPDALTDEQGAGVDRRANAEVYTTTTQLDRERQILAAAENPNGFYVPTTSIDAELDQFAATRGFSLNAGQAEMARHLLNAGTQLAVAVGPAGTGKTTSMEVVANQWRAAGHNVIGLAPSAAAAKILGADIKADARTIDSLTFAWNTRDTAEDGTALSPTGRLEKLPVTLTPGDMLLVDEAGMASTDRLATLVDIADASGAVIRMVGDPAQLDAVETGGIFRTLTRSPGTPVLTDVMRMGDDIDQAEATLELRTGNITGLDLYFDRGWVSEGSRDQMITAAVDGYLTDRNLGLSSMVIAPTNADVTAMNEMIQATLIDAGTITTSTPTTTTSDGLTAHTGDLVLARKNELLTNGKTATRVLNGQLLAVRTVGPDGSLHCFDVKSKTRVHLPTDYVKNSTQLGYASTVHRCQGATVDTTHSLVDETLDRNGLYVAGTRGKQENRFYVDTTPTLDTTAEDAHQHHSGDTEAPSAKDILTTIVTKDRSQLSAVDELRSQQNAASDPDRIRALYLEGAALATAAFTEATTTELVESLPVAIATEIQTTGDGSEPISHTISVAAACGIDAREFWLDATANLDGADDPGRLIAYRLRQHIGLQTGEEESAVIPTPPPAHPGVDGELADWLARTYDTLTQPDPAEGSDHALAADTDAEPAFESVGEAADEVDPATTRAAEAWIATIIEQTTGLTEISDTDKTNLITAAAAAMTVGADLDANTSSAKIITTQWVPGYDGDPAHRLRTFLAREHDLAAKAPTSTHNNHHQPSMDPKIVDQAQAWIDTVITGSTRLTNITESDKNTLVSATAATLAAGGELRTSADIATMAADGLLPGYHGQPQERVMRFLEMARNRAERNTKSKTTGSHHRSDMSLTTALTHTTQVTSTHTPGRHNDHGFEID